MHAMPLVKPNLSCGVPIYAQLMDQVRHGLSTGAIRPGDALPGVAPAAEALVVHPGVVARAYHELERLSLVSRRAGGFHAAATASAPPCAPEGTDLLAMLRSERRARSKELDTAGDVQRRLLPQAVPAVDGLDLAGLSRPALGVGGDYYDFIPVEARGVALVIGDVCGKGMPAALLMASLRAYLHGAASRGERAPGAVMTATNRLVHDSSPANRFITVFHAHYDPSTRVLEYVNAGHLPPVVLRQGPRGRERMVLESTGPAIGMMPGIVYDARRVTLEPGDLLVACTDGISEARNVAGDEYGERRLLGLIESHEAPSAKALAALALADADGFAAGTPQQDDMTVMVVRVV